MEQIYKLILLLFEFREKLEIKNIFRLIKIKSNLNK